MFNLFNFHEEQCEYCKDLLRQAEKERLVQVALSNRQERDKLSGLVQRLADLVRK